MKAVRVTAISYLNTLPFIHGLKNSGLISNIELNLEVPSVSAEKLTKKQADIGLVPVGALPTINNYRIISSLCIGADKEVQSVLLLSNEPLTEIHTIYLDTDSRTSVNLAKVLAAHYWKINPRWQKLERTDITLQKGEAVVLIGDKTFGLREKYNFCYDLAGEWIKFTGLPFVFAVWIAVNELPEGFEQQFQQALAWGVEHLEGSISLAENMRITPEALISYLKNDISFPLNDAKRKGMELFLKYLNR